MIDFEVFEKEKENSRDCFDDHFLVPIDVETELHCLNHGTGHFFGNDVAEDIDRFSFSLGGGCRRKE